MAVILRNSQEGEMEPSADRQLPAMIFTRRTSATSMYTFSHPTEQPHEIADRAHN
jgi:hypothetical protein